MPQGNFWPSMSCNIQVWKGDTKPRNWNSGSDPYAVYRPTTSWTNGFSRIVTSTCRESMSVGLKDIGTCWSLLFKDTFDRDIHKEITLTIHKAPPSVEWMSVWKSLWVFPRLIKRYTYTDQSMTFILDDNFIAMGAPQPMFSFPFFFTNRHEAWKPEVLADPDLVVKQLLHDDEGYWGRSTAHGDMSFSHALAAYVMNIANNKDAFYKLINCNGVGQYVLREVCISQPQQMMNFINTYKVDVNLFLRNYSISQGLTPQQIINAMRASTTVSNPTSW